MARAQGDGVRRRKEAGLEQAMADGEWGKDRESDYWRDSVDGKRQEKSEAPTSAHGTFADNSVRGDGDQIEERKCTRNREDDGPRRINEITNYEQLPDDCVQDDSDHGYEGRPETRERDEVGGVGGGTRELFEGVSMTALWADDVARRRQIAERVATGATLKGLTNCVHCLWFGLGWGDLSSSD